MTNPAALRTEHWLNARIVTDPGELAQIFRLRHRVYCEERGFFDASSYPDAQEIDEYDRRSVHFAAFDQGGEIAGSVRLVCQAAEGDQLPYQQHCQLFEGAHHPVRGRAGEVSRLVLSRGHRIPPGGGKTGTVIMMVYREMYRYSLQHGISNWYAAMERSLVRMMGRIGVEYERMGPEVDYYGPVAPYLLQLPALQQRLAQANPSLLRYLNSAV